MNTHEQVNPFETERKPFNVIGKMIDEQGNDAGYETAVGFYNWADARRYISEVKNENPGIVKWEIVDADGNPLDPPAGDSGIN